jgi:lipopolysaccharide/colanic/teichoic acid biosynthesis glycosyltransferase
MVIIAITIKWGTPGPVLFRQSRDGLNGKPFTFVKFRTLYADARERFPELYEYKYDDEEIKSIQFKTADDPRITPQGRWLRKTSLDELPNLFLVLTGDLALVGPRPQILEMLSYYKGIMLERYSVRPGLTDLAHVSGRSNLSFYETTAMDVAYVRAQSWRLDLIILWKTFISVVHGDGAF